MFLRKTSQFVPLRGIKESMSPYAKKIRASESQILVGSAAISSLASNNENYMSIETNHLELNPTNKVHFSGVQTVRNDRF